MRVYFFYLCLLDIFLIKGNIIFIFKQLTISNVALKPKTDAIYRKKSQKDVLQNRRSG